MSRNIPWSRILAEGAVIVVSILLAFSIDAWWDGVQEQRLAAAAIMDIHEELEENTAEIEQVTATHRRIYQNGIEVLEVVIGQSDPGPEFAVNASWVLSVEMRMDVATEALDRFLSSEQGGADLYPELRSRFSRFRNSIDQIWQQEDMIRGIVRDELTLALSERYDLLRIGTGSSFEEFELNALGRFVAAETPEPWDEYMLNVVRDPLIRNLVTARVGREYVAMLRAERLQAHLESLLDDLGDWPGGAPSR